MPYDNTNSGVPFKNTNKNSDKHPDYKGTIDVNGTEFWLSAWIKDGKKGKFMSLAVQPKENRPPTQQDNSEPTENQSDIPF